MNINISRHSIYLLSLSTFLLIFVLVFSFFVLIPEGKEYRKNRGQLNKGRVELRRYQEFNDVTLQKLKQLQADNGHTIVAFDTLFNPLKFKKLNREYFTSLELSKKESKEKEDGFLVYEVNTTSSISTPQNFYKFLDAINKSDWIVSVNFPINFKRDSEFISSSFTMKVYNSPNISDK